MSKQSEYKAFNNKFAFKHGMSKSRLMNIFRNMKSRCFNCKHEHYKDYGGRGITVCYEWYNFVPFMEWALSHGYSEDLTLDRINGNGNYEPDNCRWITNLEQQSNKRNNVWIEIDGVVDTASGWSKKSGVISSTITRRYHRGVRGAELIIKKGAK